MKPLADRMRDIAQRKREIDSTLRSLAVRREEALAADDDARADKLLLEADRLQREQRSLTTKAEVLERHEADSLKSEAERLRQVAAGRLAELQRVRVRIARKIDQSWAALEAAIIELATLEGRIREAASEAGCGDGGSARLAGSARMLHRGAALAIAPRMSDLMGVERLPASCRRSLEMAFRTSTPATQIPETTHG